MVDRLRKSGINFLRCTSVVALGLAMTSCDVNGSQVLEQKCETGDTEDVSGIPVAVEGFILPLGSELSIGASKITSNGNGEYEVNTPYNLTVLEDGRIVVLVGRAIWQKDQQIAIKSENQDGNTVVYISTDCSDITRIPPALD